jgi:hypothetical protein
VHAEFSSDRTATRVQGFSKRPDWCRDRVTVSGASCADGSMLLPGLIFQYDNSTLQLTWVGDIDLQKHKVFTTSSPSG